jgi:hypothetical protein
VHGIALWTVGGSRPSAEGIGEELNELGQGDVDRSIKQSRCREPLLQAGGCCRLDRETRGCGDARERGDVAQYLTRASKGDRPTDPPVLIYI